MIDTDDSLHLLFLCCHLSLTRASQVSLTLRGATFALPAADDLYARFDAVAAVIYLVFTEGHTASSGDSLVRVDLADEAVRLLSLIHI